MTKKQAHIQRNFRIFNNFHFIPAAFPGFRPLVCNGFANWRGGLAGVSVKTGGIRL